jgi:hypothetical protein
MTTKDWCLPFKDQQIVVNTDTSNGEYSNLNLNQNHQNSLNAFSVTSKIISNEKRKALNSGKIKELQSFFGN